MARGASRCGQAVCLAGALAAAASAAPACATQTAGRGEACTRTAQCAEGLACVEGTCSGDLEGLGDRGAVPRLMPDPVDGGSDAAGDGAPAPSDEDAG